MDSNALWNLVSLGRYLSHAPRKGTHRDYAMGRRGADVNSIDGRRWTPLHCAASNGRTSTVAHLLNGGAEINCKTDAHYTHRVALGNAHHH